jgi:hypothetical protein
MHGELAPLVQSRTGRCSRRFVAFMPSIVAVTVVPGCLPRSARAACYYDNAPMESFFHTLKSLPRRRPGSSSSTSGNGQLAKRRDATCSPISRATISAPDPLRPRIQDPGTGRTAKGLNPCPRYRGTINAPTPLPVNGLDMRIGHPAASMAGQFAQAGYASTPPSWHNGRLTPCLQDAIETWTIRLNPNARHSCFW